MFILMDVFCYKRFTINILYWGWNAMERPEYVEMLSCIFSQEAAIALLAGSAYATCFKIMMLA